MAPRISEEVKQDILRRSKTESYGVIAAALGLKRNSVAGIIFRAKNGKVRNTGRGRSGGHRFALKNLVGKLTERQVRAIYLDRKSTGPALAERFGVSVTAVWCIRHQLTHKHITRDLSRP